MILLDKWLDAVDRKNSVLCAGIDPAEFELGRGEKGLSEGVNKIDWALRYIEAIAPYCSSFKPNLQYWKDTFGMETLELAVALAESLGILAIDDSKLADIGSTNDAGLYHAKKKGFAAVTLAPYAGNMAEAAQQARKRDIGLITMCLMSNLEYAREKKSFMNVAGEDGYNQEDVLLIEKMPHVHRYIQLAHDATQHGLDGIVIGAPSTKNHITEGEIANVRKYCTDKTLVLLPGVGHQGGEAHAIWQHFAGDKVIVNVGRSLMFPEGSTSISEDHRRAAQHYKDRLNELRNL